MINRQKTSNTSLVSTCEPYKKAKNASYSQMDNQISTNFDFIFDYIRSMTI